MSWDEWKERWVIFIFSIVLPFLVIFMVIIYPFAITNRQYNYVEDKMYFDIESANCSAEWRSGWIACLKHFRVLWFSGTNFTGG